MSTASLAPVFDLLWYFVTLSYALLSPVLIYFDKVYTLLLFTHFQGLIYFIKCYIVVINVKFILIIVYNVAHFDRSHFNYFDKVSTLSPASLAPMLNLFWYFIYTVARFSRSIVWFILILCLHCRFASLSPMFNLFWYFFCIATCFRLFYSKFLKIIFPDILD